MDLSPDQQEALARVLAWVENPEQPFLTLGGYAGTGKTTLIKYILRSVRSAKVIAYTGKAAHVLRTKGVEATTIHRLIYAPIEVCQRSEFPVADCKTCAPKCTQVDVEFRLAEDIPARLVVVDEASMVNTEIFNDLLSFNVPILFVGDHGQLEPIGKNPRLMASPAIRLEQIHRQAEGSNVLQFAHHVRRGEFPKTAGDDARVLPLTRVPEDISTFDAVLCGRNATRVAVNFRIRRDRGFTSVLPGVGERVICLRNDSNRGIFNGMLATVLGLRTDDAGDGVLMTVEDDMGECYRDLPIVPEQFNAETALDVSRRKTLWDFGYCMTVHKSQGSQWDRVCVLEWIHRDWSAERWRYTAATRAAKQLVYCVHPRRR